MRRLFIEVIRLRRGVTNFTWCLLNYVSEENLGGIGQEGPDLGGTGGRWCPSWGSQRTEASSRGGGHTVTQPGLTKALDLKRVYGSTLLWTTQKSKKQKPKPKLYGSRDVIGLEMHFLCPDQTHWVHLNNSFFCLLYRYWYHLHFILGAILTVGDGRLSITG